MTRRFTGKRLVVASHNAGKVREIGDLLAPYRVEAISAAALNLPEPEETESTFKGNSLLKAHAAARLAKLPALAPERLATTARFFLDLVVVPMLLRGLFEDKVETLEVEIGPHVARTVAFFLAACRQSRNA